MNKIGKAGMAMICAFFVGCMASAVLAADSGGNAIALAQYEKFFGLERTPEGLWPKWLIAAYHTGEWQTNPPPLTFHVSATQEENTGVLRLQVNRSALAGEDLVLALTYDAGDQEEKGSLFIGLSSWPEGWEANEVFLGDLFGNIMQGQGDPGYAGGSYADSPSRSAMAERGARTLTQYFEIPIQSIAAQYFSVDIYRGKGEISLYGAVLYTRSEFNYWLEQALVESAAPDVASAGQESEDLAGADLAGGTSLTPKPSAVGGPAHQSAAPVALPAAQIATAVQLAAIYLTRSVFSGAGGRQTSPNLILEDSFAQSSAIGFSYGNDLILNSGYQKVNDQLLEIWNVDASPLVFNPVLGEASVFSYVLATRAVGVAVEVYANVGTNTLVSNAPQDPGLHSVVWNGKDSNGNITPGDWTFRIRAGDYQGRVVTNDGTLVTIKKNIPVILAVADTPVY